MYHTQHLHVVISEECLYHIWYEGTPHYNSLVWALLTVRLTSMNFHLVLTTPTRSLPVNQPYLPHRMLSLMDLLLLFLYWLMVAALVLHVLRMTAQLLESYRQSPRYINTYMAIHIEVRHTQSYHSYHTLLATSTVWHQVYAGPNKGLSFKHIIKHCTSNQ